MRACSLVLAITTATALRLPGGCRPAGRVARRVPGWAAAMCTDASQSLPQLPEKVEAREAGAVCCVDTYSPQVPQPCRTYMSQYACRPPACRGPGPLAPGHHRTLGVREVEPSCRIKAVRAGRVPASSIRTVRIIGAERSLVVDGETIKLDELGPIILKEDGRLGRLSNWHEMTEPEQAATLRFVAKRNAKRRKALLKAQAGEAGEAGEAGDATEPKR